MPELKLGKLPDRTPVKLSINIMPELAETLAAYGALYKATYGCEETVAELVPAMLTAFIEGDRLFQKARGARSKRNRN